MIDTKSVADMKKFTKADEKQEKLLPSSMYRQLNTKKLQEKESSFISTKQALKGVTPIEWDNEVVSGNKKVLLVAKKDV